tara:strand:+ start:767 stop:1234 length:468 start_codon:yes stop_codon:yes gene_type:complete
MSTRATITAKMKDDVWVSFYKHHDGYIVGGLGEVLMNFVTYNDPKKESFTRSSFLEFVDELEPKVVGMEKVERIMDGPWLGSYKLHGDTEFHYTFDRLQGKTFLFVQRRDYENGAQNGASNSETGHWTDFAEKNLIGVSGGPFFDQILNSKHHVK